MMKKMKKLIAASVSGLLAATMVLAMPITSNAESIEIEDDGIEYWQKLVGVGENTNFIDTDIPLVATVNSPRAVVLSSTEGMYRDLDETTAALSDEEKEKQAEMIEPLKGICMAGIWVNGDIDEELDEMPFMPGDRVTVELPFSGTLVMGDAYDPMDVDADTWILEGSTSDSVTLECIGESFGFNCLVFFRKNTSYDADREFWFQPMRTQLNIAAEVAEQTGKEAFAETDGDFGLSYAIMKWLEDHPNVTLRYTLRYNGAEHLIVIKGGQKLANPDIPWYGPEYLIGLFGK